MPANNTLQTVKNTKRRIEKTIAQMRSVIEHNKKKAEQTSANPTTHWLIDAENDACRRRTAYETLKDRDVVWWFHTQAVPTMPIFALELFAQKHITVHSVYVKTGVKNALDFQLVTILGALTQTNPADTKYKIVSNDSGFDTTLSFLKEHGYDAKRINATAKMSISLASPTFSFMLTPTVTPDCIRQTDKSTQTA